MDDQSEFLPYRLFLMAAVLVAAVLVAAVMVAALKMAAVIINVLQMDVVQVNVLESFWILLRLAGDQYQLFAWRAHVCR